MLTFAFILLLLGTSQARGKSEESYDFVKQSTNFSLNFYRHSFNPDENAIQSPVSVQATLSLLYHVASNSTAADMQAILGLPAAKKKPIPSLVEFLNSTGGSDSVLRMVSKVYHSPEDLNPKFLPLLQDSYKVEVEEADFKQKQKVADSVNRWVNSSTKGLIPDLITASDLKDNDRLILLNAITLDAKWEHPFPKSSARKTFHFVDGDHDVDIMSMDEEVSCGNLGDLNLLELPYESETDLSMLFVMPKNGSLQDLVNQLTLEFYERLNSALKLEYGTVEIPKFSINSKVKAKDVLQSMGLGSAFEVKAFKVFARKPAQLSELRQKAVINVFETGTTAAAVTEGQLVFHTIPLELFIGNRPFIYLIRRTSTKEIFFIGHYSHYKQ
ncbi:uncharacterized protein LOC120422827 [Culex pipiens pallens]|uniref:uncharacterized protein LOC120422827 n=1 Tax=Culex pipiens pallens TaxID=42434 RepID=UPI001954B4F9|nr:uncharacterized protein LOC120422827 [Culex pipiens pallens]